MNRLESPPAKKEAGDNSENHMSIFMKIVMAILQWT